MGKDLEKGIKRLLKRRVKITLGFIVAFLLSCSFAMGERLVITEDDNGKILFNGEIFDEENHQFTGNSFDGNIYINNNLLIKEDENINNYPIEINNLNKDFSFINRSYIKSTAENDLDASGIFAKEVSKKVDILNEGKILTKTDTVGDPFSELSINVGIYATIEDNGIFIVNNKGVIETIGGADSNGIYIVSSKYSPPDRQLLGNTEINNIGIISTQADIDAEDTSYYGIATGRIKNVEYLKNYGIVNAKSEKNSFNSAVYFQESIVKDVINNGRIMSFGEKNTYGIEFDCSGAEEIKNNGIIIAKAKDNNIGQAISISQMAGRELEKFENSGLLYSKSEYNSSPAYVATIGGSANKNKNFGTIIKETEHNFGIGILGAPNEYFKNYGVISADIPVNKTEKTENYGLYLSEEGEILKYDEQSGEFTVETSKTESSTEIADIGKTVINAGSNEQGFAQSIKSETIKNLSADTGYILNSYDKTVVLNSATGNKNINNSIINAVKNAVTFDGDNLTLGLSNTTVNGGYEENIILGDDKTNNLNLNGETVINGNINLNDGNDNLSLDDGVQINGTLDGGAGNNDILTFNSSVTKSSSDKNINILYNIKGFEKTNIDTNVTLFEKIIDDNGEIKNLVAELGDITIKNNGELTLRVDGSQKDGDKITGHALYKNNGSLQTDKTGKLILGLYGIGNEAVVGFGNTDISKLNPDNVDTSSYLHNIKVNGDENVIEISAKENLEDLDIANYDKLNKIYYSILTSQNLDKFNVEEKQKGAFFKYLQDIYAGNPYAYSSELSRKTMGIMRNLADKDLHPELNKWAIYGGLSHVDGGTKESFYGRNYYGYDIGSRDIEADTKITGGYFKAEYGKTENLTTGIIFGGNNAESEIGSSKVEGDSFYFGGYAKKFVNDFRFTLGAGFQHGDYKADRTAVGYSNITETRKFDSNYHDRGFDIYGDVKYSREIGNGLFFEPSFALSYTYLDEDGVSEKGTLGIGTDSKTFDYLSSKINLDVRKTFITDKLTHSFVAGVSYERLLNGYDEEYITGRIIGGTDFDILVPEKEKDNFFVNAKYELETEKGMLFDIKCSYRFEHDNNQNEWTVGAGMGYKF